MKSKTQTNRPAAAKPETEPFSVVAARAGNALADLAAHRDCNPALFNLVSEFLAGVQNEFGDLPSQLRSALPAACLHASTFQFERRDED
jgi:hypothetical protein